MMTRLFALIGWGVVGCAILSALIVLHAAISPPQPGLALDAQELETGATFARLGTREGPRLVVTSLRSGGSAEVAGMKVGDRIEDVDGLPAATIARFNRNVASGSYDEVDLRVLRNGALRDIHVARRRTGGDDHEPADIARRG